MTHQNLSLGMCWKLFEGTLKSLVLITFSLAPTSFVGTESASKITDVVIVAFKVVVIVWFA